MTTEHISPPIGSWTGPIVDADVHVNLPGLDALLARLAPQWREFVSETGFGRGPFLHSFYPPGAATTLAPRWRPDDGRTPASELGLVQEQLLIDQNVERAILNCYWALEGVRHPDFAVALAQATNQWLIEEWLDRDDRLRASMVVPAFVPAEAAAEVERVGGHPGFVQVLLPVRATRLYGQRPWHPLWAAMERHDLVAGIHYGGTPDGPPTPAGFPAWFLEDYVGHVQAFQAQLVSIVGEGIFQKFPRVRVSLLEGGFTWLGPLMWRIDKEWKGLRRDVPWIKEPPSRLIRERVRVSTQPLDAGPREHFGRVVDWLGSDDLLMYASDYPHGHTESVERLLEVLAPGAREKLMAANARAQYNL